MGSEGLVAKRRVRRRGRRRWRGEGIVSLWGLEGWEEGGEGRGGEGTYVGGVKLLWLLVGGDARCR